MSETRIDVDIILFVETREIFFEEIDLVERDTRILVTKYAEYGSSQLGKLIGILREIAIVDHCSIDGSIE